MQDEDDAATSNSSDTTKHGASLLASVDAASLDDSTKPNTTPWTARTVVVPATHASAGPPAVR